MDTKRSGRDDGLRAGWANLHSTDKWAWLWCKKLDASWPYGGVASAEREQPRRLGWRNGKCLVAGTRFNLYRTNRTTAKEPKTNHGFKYRLFSGTPDERLISDDKERGEDDHRHIEGREDPDRGIPSLV